MNERERYLYVDKRRSNGDRWVDIARDLDMDPTTVSRLHKRGLPADKTPYRHPRTNDFIHLWNEGCTVTEITRRTGVARSTVARQIQDCIDAGEISEENRISGELVEENRNLQAQLSVTQSELRDAQAKISSDSHRQVLEDRTLAAIESALRGREFALTPASVSESLPGASEKAWLLLVSDAHAGEVVNPEEALGIQYDWATAIKRIQDVFRQTKARVASRKSVPGEIVVGVLGDMLSGDIHEELAISNEKHISDQCVEIAEVLAAEIIDLKAIFPKVRAVVMVGNHSRLKKKPYYKGKYNNWEFVMGHMIRGLCKLHDIEVEVPRQLVHIEEINGYRVAMMHGDGVSSNSFAGIPFYGMRQRREAIQALLSSVGQERVDQLVMGHFHQHLYWQGECDIIINGSIKGGDEYIIGSRMSATMPRQLILEYDSDYGFVSQYQVNLT